MSTVLEVALAWRRLPFWILLGSLMGVACQGQDINLAKGLPPEQGRIELRFKDVDLVTSVNSDQKDENPTLTSDLLDICLTSSRSGGQGDFDVWCAKRDSRAEEFSEPVVVEIVNTRKFESSAALSPDGLDLWLAAEREEGKGGSDIWVSSRKTRDEGWEEPELVPALNSNKDDIPRPPGARGLIMPMASRRDSDIYATYLAERSEKDGEFSEPVLIEELVMDGFSVVDAFLSEDGLLLVHTLHDLEKGSADLYYSVRADSDSPFDEPTPILGVNTEGDERDPWLSPGGEELFFVSDRGESHDIYRAKRAE